MAKVVVKRSVATGAPVTLDFGEVAWDEAGQNLYIGNASGVPVCIAGSFKANASHGHFQSSIADLPITVTNGGTGRGTAITTDQIWVTGAGGVPAGSDSLTFSSGVLRAGTMSAGCLKVSTGGTVSIEVDKTSGDAHLVLKSKGSGSILELVAGSSNEVRVLNGGTLSATFFLGTFTLFGASAATAFSVSASQSSPITYTLPTALPSGNARLHCDAFGNLSWVLV